MASREDDFRPYTVPYSGSGAIAIGNNSFVSSSRASEIGTNTQGLSPARPPDAGATGFQNPGGSPLCGAPIDSQRESPPSSGYVYSSCNNDHCESCIDHINPYSPTYIENGSMDPQAPSHLDPPFVGQSHMSSGYVGMPTGDTHGVYHMTQVEADRINKEVNERALVAMIRSKNPPRPSNEALSSAMRILHGPGSGTGNTCFHNDECNQVTLADRKTESVSTPQALDLATTRNIGDSCRHKVGKTKTGYLPRSRREYPSGQSASQLGDPRRTPTSDLSNSSTPSRLPELSQLENPLYNCVSSPDLAKLHDDLAGCRGGNAHVESSIPTKISMIGPPNPEAHIPQGRAATFALRNGKRAEEENLDLEAPTEPEDDPWVVIQD